MEAFSGLLTTIVQIFRCQKCASRNGIHAGSFIRNCDRTKMAENTFLTALQKATSGNLPIGELIDAATRLSGVGEAALARQLYKVWINFNREHPQLSVVYFNC